MVEVFASEKLSSLGVFGDVAAEVIELFGAAD
jgi:hypothetical protein